MLKKINCCLFLCFAPSACFVNSTNHISFANSVASSNGLNPNALFDSPIFPLADNKSINFEWSSNDKSQSNFSIDKISSCGMITPFFGYTANSAKEITNFLQKNGNKVNLSKILKETNLFKESPYFSFLQWHKSETSWKSLKNVWDSAKLTFSCNYFSSSNILLSDSLMPEPFQFQVDIGHIAINQNLHSTVSADWEAPNGYKGAVTLDFSFPDISLNYVDSSDDGTIPQHYEISSLDNFLSLSSCNITFDGTSNNIPLDCKINVLKSPSNDFTFPNFYKIFIDTKDINWKELNSSFDEKTFHRRVYDKVSGKYPDIKIPINRFTFYGFNGMQLSENEIQYWLKSFYTPKSNQILKPVDLLGVSDISYEFDSYNNITSVVVQPHNDTDIYTSCISWTYSSAQGYNDMDVIIETNYPTKEPLSNDISLSLYLSENGASSGGDSSFSPYNSYTINNYTLNLKPTSPINYSGKFEYDTYISPISWHVFTYYVNYKLNISDIVFEIPRFNLDKIRYDFENNVYDCTKIFSLKELFSLPDLFNVGSGWQPKVNVTINGNLHLTSSSMDKTFNFSDLKMSASSANDSISFGELEYNPHSPQTSKFLCKTSMSEISSQFYIKFVKNSSGDYIPTYYQRPDSELPKFIFYVNNRDHDPVKSEKITLPTFTMNSEYSQYIEDVTIKN